MADTREFQQRCVEVGARIRAFREALGWSEAQLGERLSLGPDAIRKAEKGGSGVTQFVKLAELARALGTTPNAILGIQEMPERDAVMGLLQAAFVDRGMTLEQARPIAEAVLTVLDSPELRNAGIPLEDSTRSVGLYVIRQFLSREQP
jgi:transcriptional regulator with XRE-family HTH domain